MPPSLPLRMMRDGDAIPAAAGDLASHGFCLLMMAESDADAGLPDPALILADHPLDSGALLRRRMVHAVITARFGTTALPLRFCRDAQGAPKLEGAPRPLHLSFSARHATGLVGIGSQPLGVDLEFPIGTDDIPYNILREDEKSALMALDNEARVPAFLRLWTLKEAMVKAMGKGFSLPPEAIRIDPSGAVQCLGEEGIAFPHFGTILTSGPIRAFTHSEFLLDEGPNPVPFVSAIRLMPVGGLFAPHSVLASEG